MRNSLAAPWYERHKGKLITLGALSALATILGVNYRADIRPTLGLAGHGAMAWLAGPHQVVGWLLLILIVAGGFGVVVVLVALLTPNPSAGTTAFVVTLEGVQWMGWITRDGKVLSTPVPHCPKCQCELRTETSQNPGTGSLFSFFICEDCEEAYEAIPGRLLEISGRIIRRIEAQWRRGELLPPRKPSKSRTGQPVDAIPTEAPRLEDQP